MKIKTVVKYFAISILFLIFILIALIIVAFLNSYQEIPLSYRITDASFHRIYIKGNPKLAEKKIYFFSTQLETAETEGSFWGVIQPFLDGSADSIVKISIETEDGLNINEKLTPLSSFFDGRKPVVDRILLCNDCKKDTAFWDRNITSQEKHLQTRFDGFKSSWLMILDDSIAEPYIMRITLDDRVIKKKIDESCIYENMDTIFFHPEVNYGKRTDLYDIWRYDSCEEYCED